MQTKVVQQYFFYGLLLLILAFSFYIYSPFIEVLVVGVTFAVLLHPVCAFFIKKTKHRGFASIITILILLIAIALPLTFIGRSVFIQAKILFTQINDSPHSLNTVLGTIVKPIENILPGTTSTLEKSISEFSSTFTQNIGPFFSATLKTIVFFGLLIVSLFFFLKDGHKFRERIIELSPLPNKYDTNIIERLEQAVNSVIRGSLTIALIQGILAGVGLWIFGVPHAALWGSLAAFAALIPSVGTAIILVPSIIFLFATEKFFPAIGLTVWSMVIVGLIDNVLSPYLVGRGVHIHPFFILLSVLGGLALFGPVGFIIGPLSISLLYALLDIYKLGMTN